MVNKEFPVKGMTCASCAQSVEKTLQKAKGVKGASVNFANHQALLSYNPKETSPEELQQAVQDIGYNLILNAKNNLEELSAQETEALQQTKNRFWGAFIFTLPVFVLGMFFNSWKIGQWLSLFLSLPVLFYFGRHFFKKAFQLARKGQTNMDTLIALGTGVAFVFSLFNLVFPRFWQQQNLEAHVYFEAATVIITFISLGKWLEERAKVGTSAALKSLMKLQPRFVKVIRNDKEIEMPLDDVAPGMIVMIRPGERIPLDGEVTVGSSFVDESTITGEAMPQQKNSGSSVFAGTINQKGAFRFSVKQVGKHTQLGQIIETVKKAQGSKAAVQRLADKVAAVFVPAVLVITLITFSIWLYADGLTLAMLTSISVLVVACPCALGLATPTAIMAGIGLGARHKILVKNAESLERAEKIDYLIFDKTGTLTLGKPQLVKSEWYNPKEKTAPFILALEKNSGHPLADAITSALKEFEPAALENFKSLSGQGLQASFKGKELWLGNATTLTLAQVNLNSSQAELAEKWQHAGYTVIYVSAHKQLLAILAVADALKPEAAATLSHLRKQGYKTAMFTGDNLGSAQKIANQLEIDLVKADLLPSHKGQAVKELQNKGFKVAMVGDGVNDSEALALADLSIAMSNGADVALNVAQITLLGGDISLIPKTLHLAKATLNTVKQNLFWAFIYNLLALPVAAGALYFINPNWLLNPMLAGAAMAFSSVTVVLNSLRLQRVKL